MSDLLNHTFKTYIVGNREHFLYGETGLSAPPLTQTDLPFTVSLLRMLYLDLTPVYDLSDAFRRARRKLMETREARYAEEMREHVEEICNHHLYFEITRMDWRERFKLAEERHYEDLPGDLLTDLLRERDITWIPSQIQVMQEQALALIEGVMDIEGAKIPFQKRLVDYYVRNSSSDTFSFLPRPISYELIDGKDFTEVLYPRTVYDLIDFYFRECVKRELRARVCKNCQRWFFITGRSTAEYCDATLDANGRTCKERGSIRKWTQERSNDKVFLPYRREYKRRFAWIRAGRISESRFYAWSAEARKKKAECDDGKISLEEFEDWLKRP